MTIETATYLRDLNATMPLASDLISEGDDHLRLVKQVLQTTFPGRGLPEMGVVVKAADFSASTSEIGGVYKCTAGLTLTPPAIAGLLLGTHWYVRAVGGAVVIDPPDAALVNGSATLSLPTDSSAILIFDGTGWIAFVMGSLQAGTGPAFNAIMMNGNANQPLTSGVQAVVKIDTEDFDTNSCFNTGTYRWQPNVPGYYGLTGVAYVSGTSIISMASSIYKNGVLHAASSVNGGGGVPVYTIMQMNGSTDYADLRVIGNGTSPTVLYGRNTWFSGALLRAN